MFDSFKDMMVTSTTHTRWREEFGPTFKFKRLFSMSELHTSGIKALTHIVNNSTVYRRAPSTRSNTAMLLGKGLISVELDQRTHQTPAFGVAEMRLITEIFVEKAVQERIVRYGFNHDVDALEANGRPSELTEAFR
ncbi:hypothetical protein B0H14DRAFT_3531908 [Mycena olivaceomarginata]|nr:hypothetical protein B0H14DRAFT_3531908 [Mycena olivaceomarginata]